MDLFTWKIGGEAGFGIMTTGLSFSKIAASFGYSIFDYIEYPSLIRGGHNNYEVAFSRREACALKETIDYLVCLNKNTYELHKHRLTKGSLVIFDPKDIPSVDSENAVPVPFQEILDRSQGNIIMKNTIALGASLALMCEDISVLFTMIEKQFSDKGSEVVEKNKYFAKQGFDYVKKHASSRVKPIFTKKSVQEQYVLSGNDAFSLSSIIADCRLYAAYPMTPSSSVLATLASWEEKTGMVVRHSEDEIAVINTALGASFAGVRSAVGTSGGGFALMVESVSLAGVTELPLVIFMAQRAGPATGMPTWTEQADLLFTVFSGHGEFPKIVLAPGDTQEMLELTGKAFNLADIYQTPVLVLSDMYLSESHASISKNKLEAFISTYRIDRGKTVEKPTQLPYLRYRDSSDGISERLIPGYKGAFYQANSYEHSESGHTSENTEDRVQQVQKRNRKTETYLKSHFSMPKIYGDFDTADIVFVSWGSSKGIVNRAQMLLSESNKKSSHIHFTHVFPLDRENVCKLFEAKKRYILVEQNSQAQFGHLLTMETGVEINEKILKFNGRPLLPEEIKSYIVKNP